jgi:hypothetical protein
MRYFTRVLGLTTTVALLLSGCVREEELLTEPGPDTGNGTAEPLVLSPPADVQQEATGPLTAVVLGDPTATGGDGNYSYTHDAPASGFPLGMTTLTWNVTDGAGEAATAAQRVTLSDTTPPAISKPADVQTVATGERTMLDIGTATASDLVDASPLIENNMPSDGFPMGTTAVMWSAVDASGNATSAMQQVTVTQASTGPLSIAAPANVSLEASGALTPVPVGSAAVAGGEPPISVSHDAPAGGFPVGLTTVTWTAVDAASTSVTDMQQVTVSDTTAPVLTAPGAVNGQQSSRLGRTLVDIGTATASDIVDGAPTIASNAPANGFPAGTTIVNWTATDASGNASSSAQQVTIAAFTPEDCSALSNEFAQQIFPIMDSTSPLTCNGCHTGPAPLPTPNGFEFSNTPPNAADFDIFRSVARIDSGGQSIILVKARGGASHTGGDRFPDGDADPDYATLAAFVDRARGCTGTPSGGAEKVMLGSGYEQLHRVVASLASRTPTADEISAVAAATDQAAIHAALGPIVDGLVNEDAFYVRALEMYNDLLLTNRDANSGSPVNDNFDLDAFANRDYFEVNYEGTARTDLRRDTNYGIARAPIELVRYVLRNDRPFTDIVTGGYTMVNPYSAVIYGVDAGDPSFPFTSDGVRGNHDRDDFRPVHNIVQTAGDRASLPASGVLGTHSFLARYPSTNTNVNRARARYTFNYFLGIDIEDLAARDGLDLDNVIGAVPTYEDPQCTVCHDVMDPVAGLFTRRDDEGEYDLNNTYLHTQTTSGVPRMVPAGYGNTRIDAGAELPEPERDAPLRWLGMRLAADERFAEQTVRIVLRGLTGIDAKTPRAVEFVNDAKNAFMASNFDFKALVKTVALSEFFLAQNIAASESPQTYADVGAGRLLTAEELNRRISAVAGSSYAWRGPNSGSGLLGGHYMLYGGINSGDVIIRTAEPTALMDGIQERVSNQVSCERVATDLYNDGPLFPNVDETVTPDTDATAIRENIRHLHRYLLGEDLEPGNPELDHSYQLFLDTRAVGATAIPSRCRGGGGATDTNGTVVPWMAVVSYLLNDYRFFYE